MKLRMKMFEVDYEKVERAFDICRTKMKEILQEIDMVPSAPTPDPFEIHQSLRVPKHKRSHSKRKSRDLSKSHKKIIQKFGGKSHQGFKSDDSAECEKDE